jgi:cytochrome d ubiquinol oxidase subunit I
MATLLVVLGVSCYYIKNKKHINFATKCLKFAIIILAILAPLQIAVGDLVGIKVHQHQPIKTAAIEGLWETTKGAPLVLFAIPDQKNSKNNFEIKINKLASFINTHDWNGELQGLNSVSKEKQPNVNIVFFSFRVMVAIGLIILALAYYGLYIVRYSNIEKHKLFLNAAILSTPLGFLAIESGWFTAEAGRQPWVIYNQLLTKQAASIIKTENVLITFILIVIIYGVIFGFYYFKYLFKLIKKGPDIKTKTSLPFGYLQEHN